MPEAKRVYSLLWDETFTCKVKRYGIKSDAEDFVRTEQLLRVWIRGAAHQVHEQRVAANDAEVPAVAAPRPTRRRAARCCAVACGWEVLLSVQERTERVVTQTVNLIVLPQDFASPGAQLRV